MNALDQQIQEVTFKIDNEDLSVLLFALDNWGANHRATSVEEKMSVFSLRKLRQKMETRQIQTKGSLKQFKLRIEPVQAYAMLNILNAFIGLKPNNSYEAHVCRKYRDEFHQKLLSI